MNLETKEGQGIQGRKAQKEELRQRLHGEIQKMTWLQKLFLRIYSFFLGQDSPGGLLQKKLHQIEGSLRSVHGEWIRFELPTLTPKMGQRLYDLYYIAAPLFDLFDAIIHNPEILSSALTDMVEHQMPGAKKQLTDVISETELETIYRKTGEKGMVHKKLRDQIPGYIQSLDGAGLKKIFQELGIFYYLKPLILFPFDILFEQFGHNLGNLPPAKYPGFKEASIKRLPGELEKLFYSLYLVQKITWHRGQLDILYQKLIAHPKVRRGEFHPSVQTIEGWNTRLEELLAEGNRLFQEVLWKELIRLAQSDPFYTFKFTLPVFDLKTVYQTEMTIRYAEELDKFFPLLRRKMIESDKKSLFQNQNTRFLENYNPRPPVEAESFELPHFAHVDSLNLIYSFLFTHFQTNFHPFIQGMARTVLQSQKASLSALMELLVDIGNCREAILAFDRNLAAEAEWGKEMNLLLSELKKKATSHKLYAQNIEKVDKEALTHIEKSLQLLDRLSGALETVGTLSSPSMVQVLKSPFIIGGSKQPLADLLREKVQFIRQFCRLVKETQRSEGLEPK